MTILIVDDEPIIRSMADRILKRAGYQTILAESGEKAIQLFDELDCNVDLVILDENMDGLTGIQTLALLRARSPQLPCVLSSGQASDR